MIVYDLNLFRVSIAPHKADAPLVIDADAVLAGPVAAQLLQPVAGRHAEVVQLLSRVDHDELPQHQPEQFGRKPADALTPEEPLGIRVREALDHPERYRPQGITSSVIM